MRFLIDNALSPQVARLLAAAGHDAVHVRDYTMQASEDIIILERAFSENRIIVSADSDFSMLLGTMNRNKPSFILFREADIAHPNDYVDRLLAALPAVATELEAGSVVVFRRGRIRMRRLPFADR